MTTTSRPVYAADTDIHGTLPGRAYMDFRYGCGRRVTVGTTRAS
jgi:hypothetical protein